MRAGEPGVPGGATHVLRRRTALVNGLRHSHLVEDLHAALIEHVGLGKNRRLGQAADEQRVHAELRQKHRRGQARAATSDDQDLGLDL
jgi:hypothetical protein